MKILRNFYSIPILLFFITFCTSVNATNLNNFEQIIQIKNLNPVIENDLQILSTEIIQNTIITGSNYTNVEPVNFITRNLGTIYAICVILVLMNLIVQIKIIYQMIHLFFQFRKKDEFVTYSF